jgi:inorganic pyrophosphatase
MIYHPETKTFSESEKESLAYARGFNYPYGWVKESGTPPAPHCDCMLMSAKEYNLGDEVEIKLIGMFKRNDGDHKYIVVEASREINDYTELTEEEKEALHKLYPRVREGEGWFGRVEAMWCYEHCEKAL